MTTSDEIAAEARAEERRALIARTDAIESEIDAARRKLATLQGLPEPLAQKSRLTTAKTPAQAHLARHIARTVPEPALEVFVAAIQTRLSVVGWARPDGRALTWRSSAGSLDLELRVTPSDDGTTTLAIACDPKSLTTLPTLIRIQAVGFAGMGVLAALFVGRDRTMLLPAIIGGVSSVVAGGLLVWLGAWWTKRRRAQGLAQLETLSEALASDLEAAADLVDRRTSSRVADAGEDHATDEASGPAIEQEARRALPR